MKCERCGAVEEKTIFAIGAKLERDTEDWVMVEGTGKLVCPDCYPEEKKKAQEILDAL